MKSEIAIIGMAGRFPMAKNVDEFWENLKSARECINFYSKEELIEAGIDQELLDNPNYIRAQGIIEDISKFDAEFFSISPREAETMDPQHRIFLECCWEALENAGYGAAKNQRNIGIYAATGENHYLINNVMPNVEDNNLASSYQTMINNSKDFLCTRVAYKLNLIGPAVTVQTACSSSLVAVHQACIALQANECDVALAGGVSLIALEKAGYLYHPGMILSSDGKCRAFDANASGTVGGQGVGIVVLKPLKKAIEDGDNIYAVIKGSAINNDGNQKIGFSAPSVEQQANVIRMSHQKANIKANSITYVEAHGTGTELGDPIEILGLTEAFNINKFQFCAIGSVKTNIGHLDVASGIAGLIKTVLCLYYKTLVPTLNFNKENPNIDFKNSPFYVNTVLKSWNQDDSLRRAGVSSFGIGGTNAHIVLEEAPEVESKIMQRKYQLFCISANSECSFNNYTKSFVTYLLKNADLNLEDVAYTLQVGRQKFKYGSYIVARNINEMKQKLGHISLKTISNNRKKIIFQFPGQGTQYINMGRELCREEKLFRKHVKECLSIIKKILPDSITIKDILGRTVNVHQTVVTHPAIFIVEYSIAKYLMDIGVKPDAMIGHSLGEYVAACISGVISLEDALKLVVIRGKLLQSLPKGKMLALQTSSDSIKELLLDSTIDIAAINTKNSCVISGENSLIKEFCKNLDKKKITYVPLNTSHAFHSSMLDPILDKFYKEVSRVKFNIPNIPYISNYNGNWIDKIDVTDPHYWVKHLRNTVFYSKGIESILKESKYKDSIFLEVGPGQILSSLAKKHFDKSLSCVALSTMKKAQDIESDQEYLLNTLGDLWVEGIAIDWQKFYLKKRKRVALPTYSFEKQSYWLNSKKSILSLNNNFTTINSNNCEISNIEMNKAAKITDNKSENTIEIEIIKIFRRILGFQQITMNESFFNIGGDSLQALQLVSEINNHFQVELRIKDIIENPTVFKLSTIILQQKINLGGSNLLANIDNNNPVVKLKNGNNKKPIFVIHPISGFIFCYRDFVDLYSGNSSIYGIQSQPINEEINNTLDSVESIASYYIKYILEVQNEGPYYLFGTSFGGLIAYEIAQQLVTKNHKVSLLAMADTMRPDHHSFKIKDENEILLGIIELSKREVLPYSQRDCLSDIEKSDMLVEGFNLNNLDEKHQEQFFFRVKTYCKAIFNYKTKPYQGKIIFFDPREKFSKYSSLSASESWSGLINETLFYTVDGNHFSMMMKPNVRNIANILSSYTRD